MRKLALIILITTFGFSTSAYKGNIEFKQENGTSFVGKLKGDEWFSWIEDTHGNIIKFNNKSKNYEYAKLKEVNGSIELLPSGSVVSNNTFSFFGVSSQYDKIDINQLSEIWKRKREEALQWRGMKKKIKIK